MKAPQKMALPVSQAPGSGFYERRTIDTCLKGSEYEPFLAFN